MIQINTTHQLKMFVSKLKQSWSLVWKNTSFLNLHKVTLQSTFLWWLKNHKTYIVSLVLEKHQRNNNNREHISYIYNWFIGECSSKSIHTKYWVALHAPKLFIDSKERTNWFFLQNIKKDLLVSYARMTPSKSLYKYLSRVNF